MHLIAPAGTCNAFLKSVELGDAKELLALVQDSVGPGFRVTADLSLIEADEDEFHGGRRDDAARAKDIEQALGDSDVRSLVALRGGAWFGRILPRIDFSVLDRRTAPIAAFGFSELTTLVNILSTHPMARSFYDMGPAFLVYGMKRYAAMRAAAGDDPEFADIDPQAWMLANWRGAFREYFKRVTGIVEQRERISIPAKHVRGPFSPGSISASKTATASRAAVRFVGGNLTVLSTMIGSMYEPSIDPTGHWLVLEDFNDKPERFDRFLSHFTLAGYWEKCAGVLLGDFHNQTGDLLPAVLEMLEFHLPKGCEFPILATNVVGHTWPMTPLPLNADCSLNLLEGGIVNIEWPSR